MSNSGFPSERAPPIRPEFPRDFRALVRQSVTGVDRFPFRILNPIRIASFQNQIPGINVVANQHRFVSIHLERKDLRSRPLLERSVLRQHHGSDEIEASDIKTGIGGLCHFSKLPLHGANELKKLLLCGGAFEF